MTKLEAMEELLIDSKIQSYAWNKLFKRELFDTFRFPSLRNYEDYVISLQLFFAEPDIYFCNLPMYHYYYRIGSSSKSNGFERKIKTIETSYQIKDYFIAHNASKEIIAGSNYFIFPKFFFCYC